MGIDAAGTFDVGGDITVHRLGYGAMRLCGPGVWGHPADRTNPRRVLRQAVAAGVDLIDTADAYGPFVNEEQIADALHPYRGLLIATKGGLTRPGPGAWVPSGHPDRLSRCIDDSLGRLRVDQIDLYQLHAPDDDVPFEDSLGALARAREAGKIRHVGLSNVSVEQLALARQIVPIATVQNRYNLGYRSHEAVLAACEAHGIGFIPWYPLAASALTASDQGVLAQVAAAHGARPGQVALAWLLAKSPVMLPIPGTSKVAHLDENLASAGLELTEAELARLDEFGGEAGG